MSWQYARPIGQLVAVTETNPRMLEETNKPSGSKGVVQFLHDMVPGVG